jgi:hypothetical protein
MKLRAVTALLFFVVYAFSAHASPDAAASPTPTLLDQMTSKTLILLHLKHAPTPVDTPQARGGMELKLSIDPTLITLSNTRQLKVIVSLFNPSSKKYVHLNFPTSQRIEVLIRDASGKTVTTWSEDQSFTDDPASVTINPRERVEYAVSVTTREMAAGQPYTINVSFPRYPDLKVQQQVTPEK